jgi:peptidyl-prolyl cis-trans isomerase B (cyclophilin B)
MFYTVQYTNNLESFDRQSNNFNDIVNSIEFTNIDFAKIPVGSDIEEDGYVGTMENENEEGGGCLIATAAFGSEMEPQVQFLREIRDGTVMSTQSGTVFMTGFNQFYYSFSPYVADYERENPVFKEAVKVTLTPLLTSLTLLNYVEVDTEEEMLGYGIGIILLNIGMYFVAPATVIIAIKNRIKQQ